MEIGLLGTGLLGRRSGSGCLLACRQGPGPGRAGAGRLQTLLQRATGTSLDSLDYRALHALTGDPQLEAEV